MIYQAINQITKCASGEKHKAKTQQMKTLRGRQLKIAYKKKNQDQNGDGDQQPSLILKDAPCGAPVLKIVKLQNTGDQFDISVCQKIKCCIFGDSVNKSK